jgi:hypothetical protein
LEQKQAAEKLGWSDVGISHDHSGYVDEGRYVPADIFEDRDIVGINLVLAQRGNALEPSEWHLHQDFVTTLGLKQEQDVWVRPEEDYVQVARLFKKKDGSPRLMEVRASHLRDYLCARGMALYVTSYRSRVAILASASDVAWPENPYRVIEGMDHWEGRTTEIVPGGMPYGSETAVFHVGRTDVDPEEDVPSFDFPKDNVVKSESWTVKHEGEKLYRIQGELWRNEWVDPASISPIVGRDEVPSSVFFAIDAEGRREEARKLVDGSRWLWFRPDVICALAHRRGGSLGWYTRDTGGVECSPGYSVHFGINRLGLVNVYAKDIALLPDWQQRIWAGYNVPPDGKVSEELLASQMRVEPANTQAPERFLGRVLAASDTEANSSLPGYRRTGPLRSRQGPSPPHGRCLQCRRHSTRRQAAARSEMGLAQIGRESPLKSARTD